MRVLPLALLATGLSAAAAAPALGQSMNLDFGTGAAPGPAYAAAGLAGEWNAIAGPTHALVDLRGRPVAATVHHDGVARSLDDPATAGDDGALMDDGLDTRDAVLTVTIDGLIDGRYEVVTFGWTPAVPAAATLVVAGGDAEGGAMAGGPWPGGFEAGATHVVHEAAVTGGTLSIEAVAGWPGAPGFVNGIQLRRRSTADLDLDGMVGIEDFLALVAEWGDCPQTPDPCAADLDADGAVTVDDFLMLLADWG